MSKADNQLEPQFAARLDDLTLSFSTLVHRKLGHKVVFGLTNLFSSKTELKKIYSSINSLFQHSRVTWISIQHLDWHLRTRKVLSPPRLDCRPAGVEGTSVYSGKGNNFMRCDTNNNSDSHSTLTFLHPQNGFLSLAPET